MNTQAVSDAPARSQALADIPFPRRFYWLVRREVLENRSLYLVPLAVAVLIVFGFAIRLAHGPAELDRTSPEQPFTFASLLLMGATMLVAIFYCVDALYGERRDRSILFWKSLPVSDLETVLAKASIPMVVIPLITFAVSFVTQVLMLLMASARNGSSAWAHLGFGQMTWILFYHLLLGHGFWFAPFWGWLLLASAWAKRAPFLWAAVPLLVVGVLERIVFNTSYFGFWLGNRLGADPMAGNSAHQHATKTVTIASITPQGWTQFLVSPGFWFGLALTAVFLLLAVRLRRVRGPN
jgi:ABC-2 type transport system permease protein